MYKKTVLDNGLTIVTEEIPFFQSASIGIWANTGSKNENEKNNGISHFIEHMLFKGTPTRTASDIAELMDGVGGQMNAFTGKEQTCFYVRLMSQHIDLALDLLFDMLLNSTFNQVELDRERTVILDEIKMYEDSPEDMIMDIFNGIVWKNSSLGRPVIGNEETVSGITRDNLFGYMKEYYTADNLIVSATGNVKHDDFVKNIEKYSSKLIPTAKRNKPEHLISERHFKVKSKDIEQVHFILGREGLANSSEDKYVLTLLDSILGASASSRIFQEVREKRGLAYAIGSFASYLKDTGLFGIVAGTSPKFLEEVIQLSCSISEDMRKNGITPEEFKRAKEQLKGNLALSFESTSARMIHLARTEYYHNRFISLEEIFDKIDSVTKEQIEQLASKMLVTSEWSACVLGNVDEKMDLHSLIG